MAFDISLTAGMRSDLISLQGTAALLNRTQGRLSSGKQVNSAVDDPSKYFAAADHVNHASDLTTRKADMGEAIQAVKAANLGVTAITSLINQAQSLVQTARSSTVAARAALATQFNDYRKQIDDQAADSGYNGKNFLQNDSLDVLFNETGTSKLTVVGFSGDALGLGITTAAYSTGVAHTGEALALSGVANGATIALQHSGTVAKQDVTVNQTLAVSQSANVGTAQSTIVGMTLASKSAGALTHLGEVLRAVTAGDYIFTAEALSTTTAGALSRATAEVLLLTGAAFSAKDKTITLAHNGIDSNVNVYETVKFSGTITAGATAGSIHGVITISAAHHASALAAVVLKSGATTMTAGQYSKAWSGNILKITLTTAHVGVVKVGITSFNRTLVSGAAADYTRTSGTAASPGQITFNKNLSGIVKINYSVPTTIKTGGTVTLAHRGPSTIARVYQHVTVHKTAAMTAGQVSAGAWASTVFTATPAISAQSNIKFTVMAGTTKLVSGVDFTATQNTGKYEIRLLHQQYTNVNINFTYDNLLKSGVKFTRVTGNANAGAKLTFTVGKISGEVLVDYKVSNTVLSGQTLTLSNRGPASNLRVYQEIAFTKTAAIASSNATTAQVNAGNAKVTFNTPTMSAAPTSFVVKAGTTTAGYTTLRSGIDYTASFDKVAGKVTITLLKGQGGNKHVDVSFAYDKTLKSGAAFDYTRTSGNATQGATITFRDDLSGTIKADYKASNTVLSGQTVTLANKGPASSMKLYQEIAYTKTAAIAASDATNAKIAAGAAKFTVTPTMSAAPATISVMAGTTALTAGVSYTASLSAGQLTISLLQAQTKAINVSLTYDKTLVSGTDFTRTTGTSAQGAQITFNDNLSGAIKADYQVVNPVQSGRTITLGHAGTAAKVNVYQEISYTRTAAISSANATVPNINAGLATFTVTPTMAARPATITVMAGGIQLGSDAFAANFSTATGQLTISLLKAQTSHVDVSFTYDKQLTSGTDYTRTTGGPKTAAQILLNQTFSGDVKVSYEVTNTVDTGDYTVSSGSTTTAGSVTFNNALSGTVEATYSVNKTLWGDSAAITQDADKLNAAIDKLRSQASSMAASLNVITTRQDWSAGMISNLQTGSDNLTLADMNEEGANMLALQTRQQLGIQALSLASQANQSIMRLFG